MSTQRKLEFQDNEFDIEVLKDVEIFEGIHDQSDALRLLVQAMEHKCLAQGRIVLEQGEKGQEMLILISGSVSIYRSTPDGDPFKVARLKSSSHAVIGESAIITDEPRSATVICDTDSEFLVLSRKGFDQFAERYPNWALPIYRKITGVLSKRLKKLNNDLILLHVALTREISEG